jgi:hypothetical protein
MKSVKLLPTPKASVDKASDLVLMVTAVLKPVGIVHSQL